MYNLQEFTELASQCEVKVIAPVPWTTPFGKRGVLASIPEKEFINTSDDAIEVFHPRHLVIPKFGRSLYGLLLSIPLFLLVRRLRKKCDVDALFAAWADPDGVATALVSKLIGKPFIIKVLGSDINELLDNRFRRRAIRYALKSANKVIAVSNPLKQKVVEMGIPECKIEVHPNAVDMRKFCPVDKISTREKLGLPLDRPVILFVGNLVPVKGLNYLLEAFQNLISSENGKMPILLIVGDGSQKKELQSMAQNYQILEHVFFVGAKPHGDIPLWMNACDIFCLPSLNEGMPNVILEALACGKPVVASAVGGIPEMLTHSENGLLVPPAKPVELSEAIRSALNANWNSAKISKSVEHLSWKKNAQAIMNILSEAKGARG